MNPWQGMARPEQPPLLHHSHSWRGRSSYGHFHAHPVHHPVPCNHGQAKTRLLYCLLQDCKMGKPWNPRNILQQGHSICAQYLSGKDRSVLQNITSCRTARALQQHYLIPMTKGLGSIITIHKTIPHLATDRERLHMELQSRPQFFLQGNFRDEAEDSHRRVDNAFL